MNFESAIQESIRFLSSDEARRSLDVDVYWPKWNSPWWHMAVLYEMGMAERIPRPIVQQMSERLKAQLIPYFFASEVPDGYDPLLSAPCPCQLGNIYQMMSAAGVDVDEVLPWARSWFLRYQMPDGGLSCDDHAYRAHPPASSIVGTIAPLEAILYYARRPLTFEEAGFLDRGAQCLIERKLMLGCRAEFNAEERLDEEDWLRPCFPRFYLYDVLRGLRFILRWAEERNQPLPREAISGVLEALERKFPDGQIKIERYSCEGVGTRFRNAAGEWERRVDASSFPLLQRVSALGQVSPFLTVQWQEAKARLKRSS